MTSEATIEAVSGPIVQPGANSGTSASLSLRQSAALEFHASLQLLAERARFLTGAAGVAVALDRDGQFIYSAATGSLVPEIGAIADVTKCHLCECIKPAQTNVLPPDASGDESHASLAVPLSRDEKVVGFFELAPGACPFEAADVKTVTRLSAMVSTALDHLDAAEHSEHLIRESSPEPPAVPPRPVSWHAPEAAAAALSPAKNSPLPSPTDVHTCRECGFPVSGVRTVCLDCEKHCDGPKADPKSDPKPNPNPPAEMFATDQASWISAHGYTIASLLVTALAAAIIFWLR
jgi:hypothetical protein